jgi:hypothetical protein
MAGYSGTPLPQKLGIKAGARVGLSKAPAGFAATLGALPEGVAVGDADARGGGTFDVLVAFVVTAGELPVVFARLGRRLDPAGGLWIGWPKKKPKRDASALRTDVTETVVREVGLAAGLVDNKVCAIDDTWSGLRFVVRLADRPARAKAPAPGRPR